MKTETIESIHEFSGTILIPVFETNAKSLVPIEFGGVRVASKVFYGKKDTHYLVEKYDSMHVFIGIGKDTDYKNLKTIFRRIATKQKDIFAKKVALFIPDDFTDLQIEAAASGLSLGTYNLGHFKKNDIHPFMKDDFMLSILSKKDFTLPFERGLKIAKAQLETFRLVDLPPNVVTPEYLSNWARESGKTYGFSTEIFGREAATKAGLEAFLSVGRGSDKEPQFIIMKYVPENTNSKTKHVGLVGKGITFDTGGLNIKTAGMLHMKSDMAGGAAVLGAMQLISDLKLTVKVTAIVPACENSVDSKAFLPSDVIGSYGGHSIEIIDTDAEGRLILADGLSYLIKNFKPETVVDIATLTGSSVGTFGYECGALFTNNNEISKLLQQSGDSVGERLWQLPLWDAYKSDIESEIADVKNYSGKPVAGAISAAKFLEYFTDDHKAWAHLDVAGVAFGDDEFAKTKHGTAFGVHLLTKFIENL
ncbi:MAG: leucyl aminopeptidase family protein [Flavobacterium sp.]|nr:leucyl aminopeptidase family protein [Flavobacterium sp.]